MTRRNNRRKPAFNARTQPQAPNDGEHIANDPNAALQAENDLLADIPKEVAELIEKAGLLASAHMVTLLSDTEKLKGQPLAAQRALVDLALTRAYGLPVRRSLNLNLHGDAADAVQASLNELTNELPERKRPTIKDITPSGN